MSGKQVQAVCHSGAGHGALRLPRDTTVDYFVQRGSLAVPSLSMSKSPGGSTLRGQVTVSITGCKTPVTRGASTSGSPTRAHPGAVEGDGKNKTVTYVSAASGPRGLTPTSVTTDPATNAPTVQFDDIKDLAPTESATISIVVSPTDGFGPGT